MKMSFQFHVRLYHAQKFVNHAHRQITIQILEHQLQLVYRQDNILQIQDFVNYLKRNSAISVVHRLNVITW